MLPLAPAPVLLDTDIRMTARARWINFALSWPDNLCHATYFVMKTSHVDHLNQPSVCHRKLRADRPTTMLAFTVVTILLAFCSNAIAATQPNILLVYVDDLGFGDLGSYGHPVLQTPNIDALADDGLRFTSNYSPSALCSPCTMRLMPLDSSRTWRLLNCTTRRSSTRRRELPA